MSELEQKELFQRIKGMTKEEQTLAVMAIPSEILLEEISRRDQIKQRMLTDIVGILKG